MFGLLAAALLLAAGYVHGYGTYRYELPNGERVPHPCKPNYYWHGLGHINALGGGARNEFGKAFSAAGGKWTKTLCEADTDGDGKTNGEELGDPNCMWTPGGQLPQRTVDITHPAICDPMNSPECQQKNQWVSCEGLELKCDAINSPDVMNFTLRFPDTEVPAQETTYMCMVFDVPSEDDYHFIASKPFINNENVMHHVLVYGCGSKGTTAPQKPYACNMGAGYGCDTIIGGWTVGSAGSCLNPNMGMKFGMSGYKRFALEFHWNNPTKTAGTTDSSGMTFYYTSNLRPNNGGLYITGQQILVIPPGQQSLTVNQQCTSECTKKIQTGTMYVTEAFNHMHYLGKQGYLEILRDGKHLTYLTNEPEYNYDNPKFYIYDPPVEVLPGDVINTTCVFSSQYSDKYVYYGDGTSDEMCFGFFYFYPAEASLTSACVEHGEMNTCFGLVDVVKDDCNINSFVGQKDDKSARIIADINNKCNLPAFQCTDECKAAVKEIYDHPCFKSNVTRTDVIRKFQRNWNGMALISKITMCSMDWDDFKPPYAAAASNVLATPLLLGTVLKLLL